MVSQWLSKEFHKSANFGWLKIHHAQMTIIPLKYINSHAAQPPGMVIDKVKWVTLYDTLFGFDYFEVGIGS